MSSLFNIRSVYFVNFPNTLPARESEQAEIVGYGGKYAAVHLQSNSAHRLPFAIRAQDEIAQAIFDAIPPSDSAPTVKIAGCVAHFRRHVGHMPEGGVDFEHYQLIIRKSRTPVNAPELDVIIERVYTDLLPLDEYPSGFKIPDNPGYPTRNDPIVVASHTRDGGGWYTYKIFCEKAEEYCEEIV